MEHIVGFEGLYEIHLTLDDKPAIWSVGSHKYLKPSRQTDGYRQVCLYANGCRKRLFVHRLVALHFIANPNGYTEVDHIDGNRENNLVANLAWVSSCQNQHNRRQAKGCYWNKSVGKWKAQIMVDGKVRYLGYFATEDEAHAAYCAARLARNTASGAAIDGY